VYVEPINRYETNFINTVADGLAALDAINEAEVKLLLDTFHMNIEEFDLSAALRAAGDRLGYVHFADSNRQAPGRGHIDFLSLLRTLKDMGYRGRITAEILPLPDDEAALQGVAQFLNSLSTVAASR
jgi:sugar phosphate isomerase/epimerase